MELSISKHTRVVLVASLNLPHIVDWVVVPSIRINKELLDFLQTQKSVEKRNHTLRKRCSKDVGVAEVFSLPFLLGGKPTIDVLFCWDLQHYW